MKGDVDEMADEFFDTCALVERHVKETGGARVRSLVRARADHRVDLARNTALEV